MKRTLDGLLALFKRKSVVTAGMKARVEGDFLIIENGTAFGHADTGAWRMLVNDLESVMRACTEVRHFVVNTPFNLVDSLGPDVAYLTIDATFYRS